jgi:hypothetical protein
MSPGFSCAAGLHVSLMEEQGGNTNYYLKSYGKGIRRATKMAAENKIIDQINIVRHQNNIATTSWYAMLSFFPNLFFVASIDCQVDGATKLVKINLICYLPQGESIIYYWINEYCDWVNIPNKEEYISTA